MEIEPGAEQKAVSVCAVECNISLKNGDFKSMKKTSLTEVTVNSAAGPSPNINTSSSSLNAMITPKKTSPSTSQRSDTTSSNRRLEPASSVVVSLLYSQFIHSIVDTCRFCSRFAGDECRTQYAQFTRRRSSDTEKTAQLS